MLNTMILSRPFARQGVADRMVVWDESGSRVEDRTDNADELVFDIVQD